MIKIGKRIVNEDRIQFIYLYSEERIDIWFIGDNMPLSFIANDAVSEFDRLVKILCCEEAEDTFQITENPLALFTPDEVNAIVSHLAQGKRYFAMDLSDRTVYAYKFLPVLKRGASEWTPAVINDGDIVDGKFAWFPLYEYFDAVTERFVEPQEK